MSNIIKYPCRYKIIQHHKKVRFIKSCFIDIFPFERIFFVYLILITILNMGIKGKEIIQVYRYQNPDGLYTDGIDIAEHNGGIVFTFDLSTNLRQRGDTNQKLDANSLEENLKVAKIPRRIDMNLSDQGYKKITSGIMGAIQRNGLEKPYSWYVRLKVIDTYILPCKPEFKKGNNSITLDISNEVLPLES
jgi:hypothetical protein